MFLNIKKTIDKKNIHGHYISIFFSPLFKLLSSRRKKQRTVSRASMLYVNNSVRYFDELIISSLIFLWITNQNRHEPFRSHYLYH